MHVEALTEQGHKLFPCLRRFSGFYLVGGTALSLQIGHRLSIDFDLFTDAALPARLLSQVRRVFKDVSIQVTYRSPEQLNLSVNDVKLTFLQYGYAPVEPFRSYQNVPMLGLRELAATKAFAIGRRLSMKDYVDWYFLLKEKHVSLREVIEIASKKYGGDFNDRLFLSQLASVCDVPPQKIDFLRDAVKKDRIEAFLSEQVRNFPI